MYNSAAAFSPIYGPTAPKGLPQQDEQKIILIVDKFQRAQAAMEGWAKDAKECVDFMEGRQWTTAQIAKLQSESRAAMVFNKVSPLVRLVLGYFRNNRTDIRYLPGHDGSGTDEVAEILTHLFKTESERNQLPFVDAEVFMDGIVTGRGYWDTRLDFSENDFGEVKITACDPFSILPDPEADGYDLNTGNSIREARWVSVDEVESVYGKQVTDLVRPFTAGNRWSGFPTLIAGTQGEITPIRNFGLDDGDDSSPYWGFRDVFHQELIDDTRKNIRVIDTQHYVSEIRPCFIDLETGDRAPIPPIWGKDKIARAMYHAERIGNPLAVERRPVRRVRWSVLVGDVIVHDDWSPYDSFTKIGYFPYFRRGITGGMVKDLIDPQREVNKRRMVQIEIAGRTANGGWTYEENSLDPIQEQKLKKLGSKPGLTLKYKQGTKEPHQIDPSPPAMAMERLEQKANDDMRQISGINESALGQLDKVQSGRAIEARQRQAVIALQMYMDNFTRSKELIGRKALNLFQKHYTEQRIFRTLGEDGKQVQHIINETVVHPDTGTVMDKLRDITLGKYAIAVDETPMSASFQNAQFEEMLSMIEKLGDPKLAGVLADILIDLSSMPRKDEVKQRLARMGMGGGAQGGPPDGGGGMPVPGGPAQQGVSIDAGPSTAPMQR